MSQRKTGPCPTCLRSARRGLLWLGGNEYVECPDCGGPSGGHPGVFLYYEELIVPGRSILVPGRRDGHPAVAVASRK